MLNYNSGRCYQEMKHGLKSNMAVLITLPTLWMSEFWTPYYSWLFRLT